MIANDYAANGQSIYKRLTSVSHVVIAGHKNADGDTFGACTALAQIAAGLGLNVTVLLSGYQERFIRVLGNAFHETEADSTELFISLDCADIDRLPENAKKAFDRAQFRINIDHHRGNTRFADENIVDEEISSTCELVYRLFTPLVPLNQTATDALYTGILTDTGCFRHQNTSPDTMRAAADLMERGARFNYIYREIVSIKTEAQTKLQARALSNMKRLPNGVAYCVVRKSDISACNADLSDLEGLTEQILNNEGVTMAFLLSERPDYVKLSMRGINRNVRVICVSLGGGGHDLAAGADMKTDVDTALALVLSRIETENTMLV